MRAATSGVTRKFIVSVLVGSVLRFLPLLIRLGFCLMAAGMNCLPQLSQRYRCRLPTVPNFLVSVELQ